MVYYYVFNEMGLRADFIWKHKVYYRRYALLTVGYHAFLLLSHLRHTLCVTVLNSRRSNPRHDSKL